MQALQPMTLIRAIRLAKHQKDKYVDKKGFPKSNSNKSNLTAHEFFNQTNNKYQTPLLPKPQYSLSIKNLSPTKLQAQKQRIML